MHRLLHGMSRWFLTFFVFVTTYIVATPLLFISLWAIVPIIPLAFMYGRWMGKQWILANR